ncbi:MAG: adenylate/guanylate cyclase domain-containing protein [Bacteroidia bacterium]
MPRKYFINNRDSFLNILFFVSAWVLAGNLYAFFKWYGFSEYSPILADTYSYSVVLLHLQLTLGGFLLGLITGLADNRIFDPSMRKKPLFYIILLKALFLIVTIVFVVLLLFMISQVLVKQNALGHLIPLAADFFLSRSFIAILVYCSFFSFIISFTREVSRKLGIRVIWNMLTGKYYQPITEESVFLFIDLKSSTTYAEDLGHLRFSMLIQDCFYHLARVVRKCHAEVYQYVGDEVVLTWRVKKGQIDVQPFSAFFAFEKVLQLNAGYYRSKYGFVPVFKAGMDAGFVTIVEVGEIKSEIAYHGDVLNTAARLEGQCNVFHKKLLISENVKSKLPDHIPYTMELIGDIDLKGKNKTVKVYAVEEKVG